MADPKVAVSDELAKLLSGPEGDPLREAVLHVLQGVMEAEVSSQIGAQLYERSEDRKTHRNGYRSRIFDTRLGDQTRLDSETPPVDLPLLGPTGLWSSSPLLVLDSSSARPWPDALVSN